MKRRRSALLVVVLVVLPITKTAMAVGAPFLHDFAETGNRSGFYVFWATYLIAEVVLVALAVKTLGVSSLRPTLLMPSVVRWLGLCLVTAVVVAAVARTIGAMEVRDSGSMFNVQGASTSLQRAFLLGAVVIAVFCEEVLFRWFAVEALRDRRSSSARAIALSSVSFGIFHLDFSAMGVGSAVLTGLGGALLGWIYVRTKSLAWPLLLHASVIAPIVVLAPTRVP